MAEAHKSLEEHEEYMRGFTDSTNGRESRTAYMKRHGLKYKSGQLAWAGRETYSELAVTGQR